MCGQKSCESIFAFFDYPSQLGQLIFAEFYYIYAVKPQKEAPNCFWTVCKWLRLGFCGLFSLRRALFDKNSIQAYPDLTSRSSPDRLSMNIFYSDLVEILKLWICRHLYLILTIPFGKTITASVLLLHVPCDASSCGQEGTEIVGKGIIILKYLLHHGEKIFRFSNLMSSWILHRIAPLCPHVQLTCAAQTKPKGFFENAFVPLLYEVASKTSWFFQFSDKGIFRFSNSFNNSSLLKLTTTPYKLGIIMFMGVPFWS